MGGYVDLFFWGGGGVSVEEREKKRRLASLLKGELFTVLKYYILLYFLGSWCKGYL